MANTNEPRGFTPLRHKNGAPYNAGMGNPYYIASTYATALFVGDPVTIVAGGSNSSASTINKEEFPAGTLQSIEAATAGATNYITGVITGFYPTRDDLSKQYSPASTEGIAWVADDPDLIFVGQEDSAGSENILAADIGLNADLVAGSGGSTVTGISSWMIDSTSANTTSTLQIKIMKLRNVTDNTIAAADTPAHYGQFEFMINLHTQRNLTGV